MARRSQHLVALVALLSAAACGGDPSEEPDESAAAVTAGDSRANPAPAAPTVSPQELQLVKNLTFVLDSVGSLHVSSDGQRIDAILDGKAKRFTTPRVVSTQDGLVTALQFENKDNVASGVTAPTVVTLSKVRGQYASASIGYYTARGEGSFSLDHSVEVPRKE